MGAEEINLRNERKREYFLQGKRTDLRASEDCRAWQKRNIRIESKSTELN